MKITIEPTNEITTFNGAPVRVWKGITQNGVPCNVLVTAIETDILSDHEFAKELVAITPPSEVVVNDQIDNILQDQGLFK